MSFPTTKRLQATCAIKAIAHDVAIVLQSFTTSHSVDLQSKKIEARSNPFYQEWTFQSESLRSIKPV
jgi:hypothetical protein